MFYCLRIIIISDVAIRTPQVFLFTLLDAYFVLNLHITTLTTTTTIITIYHGLHFCPEKLKGKNTFKSKFPLKIEGKKILLNKIIIIITIKIKK